VPAGPSKNVTLTHALHWFIFTSLLLYLGATTSAVFSFIMLSDLPGYAREMAIHLPESLPAKAMRGDDFGESLLVEDTDTILLRRFGLGRTWEFTKGHMIICFILGCLCSFVTVGLWAWSLEVIRVSVAVLIPLALIALPPFLVFLYLFIGK
jgi:hypothetical protein